jgi:hypothetical protein
MHLCWLFPSAIIFIAVKCRSSLFVLFGLFAVQVTVKNFEVPTVQGVRVLRFGPSVSARYRHLLQQDTPGRQLRAADAFVPRASVASVGSPPLVPQTLWELHAQMLFLSASIGSVW